MNKIVKVYGIRERVNAQNILFANGYSWSGYGNVILSYSYITNILIDERNKLLYYREDSDLECQSDDIDEVCDILSDYEVIGLDELRLLYPDRS